jgi:hypothetical protein
MPRKRKKGGGKQNRLEAPLVLFTGNTGQKQTAPPRPANAGRQQRAAAKGLVPATLKSAAEFMSFLKKRRPFNKEE